MNIIKEVSTIGYNCSNIPLGPYHVLAFATYPERQRNPNQNDISNFTFVSATFNNIIGFVRIPDNGKKVDFVASCTRRVFNDFQELYLRFTAPVSSRVNNCSGVYNFFNETKPFAPVLYLGGPSLITGDPEYNPCEGGRYGAVFQGTIPIF
jgi:hypothetical protein